MFQSDPLYPPSSRWQGKPPWLSCTGNRKNRLGSEYYTSRRTERNGTEQNRTPRYKNLPSRKYNNRMKSENVGVYLRRCLEAGSLIFAGCIGVTYRAEKITTVRTLPEMFVHFPYFIVEPDGFITPRYRLLLVNAKPTTAGRNDFFKLLQKTGSQHAQDAFWNYPIMSWKGWRNFLVPEGSH